MGTVISKISHRITVEYIETAKIMLNHNKKLLPLIVDVDKISEFLHDDTAWSTSGFLHVDKLYWEFMCWLRRKHSLQTYNKKIFIEKLSKKRTIINNHVQHIKLTNIVNEDVLRF